MPDDDQPVVCGWMLEQPSASGGKVYVVLLFSNYTAVGYGPKGGTLQWIVTNHGNPDVARRVALMKTREKEGGGYTVTEFPRAWTIGHTGMRAALQDATSHTRGANSTLTLVASNVLASGTPLT